MRCRPSRAMALLVICLSGHPASATAGPPASTKSGPPACLGEKGGSGRIEAIEPNGTIRLQNSTRLKLAGIELISKGAYKKLHKNWQGKQATYHPVGPHRDHLGRIRAQLLVHESPTTAWLQRRLVEEGQATPAPPSLPGPCFKALLAIEQQARKGGKGIWASAATAPLFQAADLKALNNRPQGEFTIVRGTIAGIGHSANNVFINFSKNWRQDFTVPIARSLLKRKSLTWPDYETWRGRSVEVRGWLDHWNGPMIRITHPEALRLLPPGPAKQAETTAE